MKNKKNTQWYRVWVFVTLTIALCATAVLAVAAQNPAWEVSRYSELPVKGQLIISPGQQFVPPPEWDGLNCTIWRGMGDESVEPVIQFGKSIASDRSDIYGGSSSDYPTVVWSDHPRPGWTRRESCDLSFGSDAAILDVRVAYGDAGCFTMLEYNAEGVNPVDVQVQPSTTPTEKPAPTTEPPKEAKLVPAAPTPTTLPSLVTLEPAEVHRGLPRWVLYTLYGVGTVVTLFLIVSGINLIRRRRQVEEEPVGGGEQEE